MFGIKRDAASSYGWFVLEKMTSANCKSYFLAALTVCLFVGACLAQDDEEYHDARGGFSVRLTSQYPNQSDLMFKLEQFTLLGTAVT